MTKEKIKSMSIIIETDKGKIEYSIVNDSWILDNNTTEPKKYLSYIMDDIVKVFNKHCEIIE